MRGSERIVVRLLKFCLDLSPKGIEDGFGSAAIVQNTYGQAFRAGADEDLVTWDCGFEKHFPWQEVLESQCCFPAFRELLIEHGEADTKNVEAGVDDAEAIEAFEKFWNRADSEGFRLLGDEECIDGCDDVIGDAKETCGGIDDADVKAAGCGISKECADACEVCAGRAVSSLVIAGLSGCDEGKCLQACGDDEALERDARIVEKIIEAGQKA